MRSHEFFIEDLCSILAKNKALKRGDAQVLKQEFAGYADMSFEYFLLDQGIVEKEDLLKALAEYYQTKAIDVTGEFFEHNLVRMFPKDVMLRNSFIPYEKEGDVMIVIASNPYNEMLPEIIGRFVSYDVTFLVGIQEDINDAVKEYWDQSLTPRELDITEVEAEQIDHEADERIQDHIPTDEE